MKISEILHLAADSYLSERNSVTWDEFGKCVRRELYSCNAIRAAIASKENSYTSLCSEFNHVWSRIRKGLQNMGLNTSACTLYCDRPYGERQNARYMWLKWAALMAEEQGE